MPPKDISQYRVYVHYRNRRTPSPTNTRLGSNTIPSTWDHQDKTFYWSALDNVLEIIVFSETDPRCDLTS